MKKLRQWVRFKFDGLVLGGVAAGAALLTFLTIAIVVICAAVVVLAGLQQSNDGDVSFIEASWQALMRTLDPGTMGGDGGWGFRATSLVATLAGICILSVLIGVITAGIDTRLSELRRGRGAVTLSGHTVILGWSPSTETMVGELAEANRSRYRPAVVVLSRFDASLVRDELGQVARRNRHQRLFFRSGSTSSLDDLQAVSLESARSVIVSHGFVEHVDAENIRTTLAIVSCFPNFRGTIVTQIEDPNLAATLREATEGRVEVVVTRESMSRITAQVCRSTGLSRVYEDLLDFDGSEIYLAEAHQFAGHNFGTAFLACHDSVPIGILRGKCDVMLCPLWDEMLLPSDQIIAVSEDDSTLEFARAGKPYVPTSGESLTTEIRNVLIVGWSAIARDTLSQLDSMLPEGSTVTLCAPQLDAESLEVSGIVTHSRIDPDSLQGLRELVSKRAYDSILLLCDQGQSAVEDDSLNLLRLIELRQALSEAGCPSANANVVTELRDLDDSPIAQAASSDFIVSDRVSSLLVSQLSEEPKLSAVFRSLFGSGVVDLVTVKSVMCAPRGRHTFHEIRRLFMTVGVALGVVDHRGEVFLNPHGGEEFLVDDDLFVIILRRLEDDAKTRLLARDTE